MGPLIEKILTNANPTERLVALINQFFVFQLDLIMYCTFAHFYNTFLHILNCICIPNIVSLLY